MAKSVAPSSVTDIIRLIEAAEDPFTTLGLPLPSLDDLGRPFTDLTDTEVSKAFRARSLRLHPDKCPLPEARAAFDKLNAAHRELRDDISRSHAVRQWAATSDATISKSTMVEAIRQRATKERDARSSEAEDIARKIALRMAEKRSGKRAPKEPYSARRAKSARLEVGREEARCLSGAGSGPSSLGDPLQEGSEGKEENKEGGKRGDGGEGRGGGKRREGEKGGEMGRGRGDQEGNEKGRQGIGVMMGRPGRHVSVGMARWRQDRTAELGRKDGGDELAQMGRGAEGEGRINGEGEKGGASGVEQKRGTEREGEKGGASGMEQNMPRKIPPGLAERLRKRGILMDS